MIKHIFNMYPFLSTETDIGFLNFEHISNIFELLLKVNSFLGEHIIELIITIDHRKSFRSFV